MRPTYKEQEKHLHEQYIAGLVEPYDTKFCFCGNLLGHRSTCSRLSTRVSIFGSSRASIFWPVYYTPEQLFSMETALFKKMQEIALMETGGHLICNLFGGDSGPVYSLSRPAWAAKQPWYETALFNGMVAALKELKEVHRSWGEDVDGELEFTPRSQVVSVN